MLSIKSPVLALPKIGPKYKKLLEKLEIYTIEDLLYHFPFRYQDYSTIKLIKDLNPQETVTVVGILTTVKNIYTRGNKRFTKATIVDHTGELDVLWFNQHYLARVLKTGKTYSFSGKVDLFSNNLTLISPDFEEKGKNLNTGRLVPIYPETAGLRSKWLRSKVHDTLGAQTDIEEFLPEETLKSQNLKGIKWAINQIHFPDGEINAKMARKRFEFEELFLELLNVQKRKSEWSEELKGYKFKPYAQEIKRSIKNLPFTLTKSQETAVKEIIEDVQQAHPMNRLLEGDVGTGKTIVAIISAYLVYLNGYKTLYMAPTGILAKQHYETFQKFLPNTKIALSTASDKIEDDGWDILIGTHALLFSKQKLKKVGLIVIDEQHRFGVEQRGKLLELGKSGKTPHLLTMTATPIPRTLALTIYGDLTISALKTHPNKQRKITTKVIPEKQREEAYKWIKEKGEPTFIVCPLIEESESASLENVKAAKEEYETLKNSVFKDVVVGLLHGRMKSKEKADVMEKFRQGEIKILVSTPVIEVGIDIPDATVIVIESAERYGLASLHQLRGRVGRGQKSGFCFTFMSTNSKNSYRRLKNLENVNDGLKLAEIDMRTRGHGDIFGIKQHGFKRFKVANLNNLEMLEAAKVEAQKAFENLDKYPKLSGKLIQKSGKCVPEN